MYEPKEKHNMADFYIWLVENYCIYLNTYVEKMDRVYAVNNPFEQDYYILDAVSYLYNNKFIDHFPVFMDGKNDAPFTPEKKLPKNQYRIEFERKQR